MKNLHDIQKAGAVVRYHTYQIPVQQTVAHHSWGVAMIILHYHPSPTAGLLRAALYHDTPEFKTGDVPYPAKRDFPDLNRELDKAEESVADDLGTGFWIPGHEVTWLKWADMMEAHLWATHLWKTYGFPLHREIMVNSGRALHSYSKPTGFGDSRWEDTCHEFAKFFWEEYDDVRE